ncbi:acyl-CoA synthetase [Leifsonia tongyongensis]|nr:acyl-CoA synthetase [Diaminobutyricibacter tongyongensis]
MDTLTLRGPEDLATIEGVPLADRDIAFTTYDIVRRAAASSPDATATVWIPDPSKFADAHSWTFAELLAAVHRIGNALVRLGVGRQDAVTLVSPNTGSLFATILAAEAVGIAAPINPVFDVERIGELMRTTGSRVVVAAGPEIDPGLWERLLDAAGTLGLTALLALRPDGAGTAAPRLGHRDGVTVAYLETLAATADPESLMVPPPRPDDVASFFHTGGTTGAPKVAAHTHSNEATTAWALALAGDFRSGAAILAGLPLFHVNALMVTGLAPLVSGACSVWPGPRGYRDPGLYGSFWKIVEHYSVSAMSAVPTVYGALAAIEVDARIDSLSVAVVGAAPLPHAVREAFFARTGIQLREGYGLTEATCASSVVPPGAGATESVGQRLPYQHIKAVDIDTDGDWHDLPPGRVGELVISGPAVYAGYVRQTPAGRVLSRDGVVDGWLRTGDLGSIDENQIVSLRGRNKDVIIRGGHNIDPMVIEEALLSHPSVVAVGAVGWPDRKSGEVPVAYVVPKPGAAVAHRELMDWAAAHIDEAAARPVRLIELPELPLTAIGKPFKPALREDAAARAAREELEAAGQSGVDVAATHVEGQLTVTVAGSRADIASASSLLRDFEFVVTGVTP